MLLFDIEKVCRTKYSPKNKYFFASFNKDRWLSLNDKTKDYNNRNTGGQVNSLHEVTQLRQYSGWKYAYLSARTKNIISRKLKYIFTKKHTTTIRTYWATKYESRRENEFWVTCHTLANLFDGCWHPLLRIFMVLSETKSALVIKISQRYCLLTVWNSDISNICFFRRLDFFFRAT